MGGRRLGLGIWDGGAWKTKLLMLTGRLCFVEQLYLRAGRERKKVVLQFRLLSSSIIASFQVQVTMLVSR
jgi:hypothetical protein